MALLSLASWFLKTRNSAMCVQCRGPPSRQDIPKPTLDVACNGPHHGMHQLLVLWRQQLPGALRLQGFLPFVQGMYSS